MLSGSRVSSSRAACCSRRVRPRTRGAFSVRRSRSGAVRRWPTSGTSRLHAWRRRVWRICRLAALEERVEADLALGRHAELVGELEALIVEHPYRERLRGQLMLALYRSGRQADALRAYRDARAALDELGIEPGQPLKQLEQQILTQDAALELSAVSGSRPLRSRGPRCPGRSCRPRRSRSSAASASSAALRALLERAAGGEGGLVLLGAEAGGGKTRLVREFAHEAAAEGVLVCYGVSDAAVSTPYQPLQGVARVPAAGLRPRLRSGSVSAPTASR